VVESLVELADTLVAEFDLVDLLSLLSERCVELLGAAEAGLLLAGDDARLHVMASSSERRHNLELFEVQRAEGPCLEVLESGRAVVNVSLVGDGRWPSFAPRARAAGYRTVHALPMRHDGSVIGVVNLFGAGETHLGPGEVTLAQALADIASFAIVQDRALRHTQEVADHLREALRSRVAVEQAKGVLSKRLSVDVDAAFRLLRR
jgi:GAF domain-containing protein